MKFCDIYEVVEIVFEVIVEKSADLEEALDRCGSDFDIAVLGVFEYYVEDKCALFLYVYENSYKGVLGNIMYMGCY